MVVAAGVFYATLPGVDDAEARAHAQLRAGRGLETGRLPQRVAAAFVAIEDRRFYEHGALDLHGLVRAAGSGLTQQGVDPGGSTVTQQLAKLLYPGGAGVTGRLHDIGLAFKLERRYSKAQVLELYLTSIYLGDGSYGVQQAARGYYRRSADRLSWAQASMLAGLAQAPTAFDPRTHFAAARRRQREVVAALVRARRLSGGAARSILADPRGSAPVGRCPPETDLRAAKRRRPNSPARLASRWSWPSQRPSSTRSRRSRRASSVG